MADPKGNTAPESKTTETGADKSAAGKHKSDPEGSKTDRSKSAKAKVKPDESRPTDAGGSDGTSEDKDTAGRRDQPRQWTRQMPFNWLSKASPHAGAAAAEGKPPGAALAKATNRLAWLVIGLLVVAVAILTDYCANVSLELAASEFTVRALQDEAASLKAADLRKCVKDLRSCVSARDDCFGGVKHMSWRDRWLVSLQDADFDICTASSLGEFYERELQALNLSSIESASTDQLRAIRRYKKRRMAKTWHPDKAALDVSVSDKIMMRLNMYSDALDRVIRKMDYYTGRTEYYAQRRPYTGSKNDMMFRATWADALSDVMEVLRALARRFMIRLRGIPWAWKIIWKRHGIWHDD
jgi:hypothetical protein